MTAASLLAKLEGVQGRGPRWRAICPAHRSRHNTRSLSILETDDGRLLLHCHAGCGVQDVLGALGIEFGDLYPPTETPLLRPVRKPWRASDVLAALRGELMVAFALLSSVRAGVPVSNDDRQRAGVALDRIVLLLSELEHAHG